MNIKKVKRDKSLLQVYVNVKLEVLESFFEPNAEAVWQPNKLNLFGIFKVST